MSDYYERYRRFNMRVRMNEFAAMQRISLLDTPGFGRSTLYWLYHVGIDTADKIMTTPTAEIVARLRDADALHGNVNEKVVENWRDLIRSAWASNIGEPTPDSWIA